MPRLPTASGDGWVSLARDLGWQGRKRVRKSYYAATRKENLTVRSAQAASIGSVYIFTTPTVARCTRPPCTGTS